jgi:hypothetical protein
MNAGDVQAHLPSFAALEKAHQNLLSGKARQYQLAPLAAKPVLGFQLQETMACRGKLKQYLQTGGGAAERFQYGFCLASKVCPGEMDDWIRCFQARANAEADLGGCAREKRAAERCAAAWAQDLTRVLVDHDLYRTNK